MCLPDQQDGAMMSRCALNNFHMLAVLTATSGSYRYHTRRHLTTCKYRRGTEPAFQLPAPPLAKHGTRSHVQQSVLLIHDICNLSCDPAAHI